jgi:hypothetical protein
MTRGGGTLTELQSGKLADALAAKKDSRDEIVAGYGVPPAEAGIIESGNLGGGTGDAQHRMFHINTCDPLGAIVLEKLNFHIAVQGFGVQDWHSKFGEVDYRDSLTVEQIRDIRLRNGSWTRNRYASDIDEPPVEGGDDAFIVNRQEMVLYRDLSAISAAQVTKAEQPPPPVLAVPGQPPAGDGQAGGDQDDEPSGPAEAFRAAYHARFRETLARWRAIEEDAA